MARLCAEKISPAPLPPEPWIQGSMDPCFHAVYGKFAPTSLVSPLMCDINKAFFPQRTDTRLIFSLFF